MTSVLAAEPVMPRPLRLPRMADAAFTVTAAEPALGWPAGTFLDLINENDANNASAILDGDVVADMLQTLALPWVGELKDLVKLLPALGLTSKKLANKLRRLEGALSTVPLFVRLPKDRERQGVLRGKRLVEITNKQVRLSFEDKLDSWTKRGQATSAPTEDNDALPF